MLSAVVLAAGQSRRMGSPKINLPWGRKTVLGQVVGTLLEAGLDEIILVTGAHAVVGVDEFLKQGIKLAFNPDYASGEMLSSFQVGLQSTAAESQAALLALGDQPQMELAVVRAVVQVYTESWPRIFNSELSNAPWAPGGSWQGIVGGGSFARTANYITPVFQRTCKRNQVHGSRDGDGDPGSGYTRRLRALPAKGDFLKD